MRPIAAYGTPDELKALVDAAHDHGLMIFLDVVYNHFGPDGNYLQLYAPQFFRDDVTTPWGAAIDFRRPEVRALLHRERALLADGISLRRAALRRRARHRRTDWLDEMAAEVRATVEPGRHVHLVLEHDGNDAVASAARTSTRSGTTTRINVLHVLLTGEDDGYYADYAEQPAWKLARCLAEGFVYQGEPSPYRRASRAACRAADLPPTAFVLFLQNHDQIGNRAFGERLTDAGRTRRARGRDRAAAAVSADPAAVHGRGEREPRRRSCSSPTTTASSPTRCARGGGTSSRGFRHSPIPPAANGSPIRMRRRPSLPRCRMRIPCSGRRARRSTGG